MHAVRVVSLALLEKPRRAELIRCYSATASKTNWITCLTGVSHERLQVFHRWIAYAFLVLALLHTFPFIVYHVHWHEMEMTFSDDLVYYWTGIVAIIAQAWLTFASHSSIR